MIPLFIAFNPPPVEALVYSTMPSLAAHRPEMAMDGDGATTFRSVYGMSGGDDFLVLLSRPISARSIRVTTGEADGSDLLTDARLETSVDGTTFAKAASFDAKGVAEVRAPSGEVVAIRIRTERRRLSAHLVVREIAVDSPDPIAHVQMGPGRGFTDLGGNADLAVWAAKAERQMESFWPDAAALLYSHGFVTPNAVNVQYRTGPGVTAVAATGGGVMTVNTAWCRAHPDDTGLTVHEMAHVIQSGGAPGWLIEAVADYIRWIEFEPENYKPRIDVAKATPHDPYRTGATFLGWCELHYDSRLVTKLNDATRFGRYKDALFQAYCGKSIDALWAEFIADYKRDPVGILAAPASAAMRPRSLPTVAPGSSVSVDLPFDTVGIAADGARTRANGGFDGEGSTYSGTLLGRTVSTNGVAFRLGPVGAPNVVAAGGKPIPLSGSHRSLWLLAAAIEGGQRDGAVVVVYADGTTARFAQNFSDWYATEEFPGEVRAVKMPYRNLADGSRDPRAFFAYAYGFALDPTKPLRSVTLPEGGNVRVLAVSLAD